MIESRDGRLGLGKKIRGGKWYTTKHAGREDEKGLLYMHFFLIALFHGEMGHGRNVDTLSVFGVFYIPCRIWRRMEYKKWLMNA